MIEEDPRGPKIKTRTETADAREDLRKLIKADPVSGVPTVETDGVQVGDGDGHNDWDPNSFDYANNGYKGVQAAADAVDSVEMPKPGIEVGKDLIDKHRDELRRIIG